MNKKRSFSSGNKKKKVKKRIPIAPPSRIHKSKRDYDRKREKTIPRDFEEKTVPKDG